MAVFYNTSTKYITLITGSNENSMSPSGIVSVININIYYIQKSSLIEGNWYYFFISVDYPNKLSYFYFYNPNTTLSYSLLSTFASINPSFNSNLKLVFGIDPFNNPNNYCGISGNLYSIFHLNYFVSIPNQFLYRNGLNNFSFSENVGQLIFNGIQGGINASLGNGITVESQDPLWDQSSFGIKINQSTNHITIPNFNFMDTSSQAFAIYINAKITNFLCSPGYVFQRIQANLQTRFGIYVDNSTNKIGITINSISYLSGITISADIVSVSCTQFKRPNITCFIFNSTSFDQITGSGIYSDQSTDTIYLGSYNCSNLGYIRKYVFFTGSTAFMNTNWQCISSCNIGISLLNSRCLNYQLLPVCPSSTFSTSSGCLTCDLRCKLCNDYSNNICAECNPGFQWLFNQTCNCEVGTYLTIDSTGNALCQPCSPTCFECYGSATACISCNSGYYLSGGSCLLCNTGCLTCFNSGTSSCLTCAISYYLQSDYKTCSNTCPAPTIIDSSLNICSSWINVIKDLDYDTAIWNSSLWTVIPDFNKSKMPIYSKCGNTIIFGGINKFEEVVSINRTFLLPSHNRIYFYAKIYALNSGWAPGNQIYIFFDEILVMTLYPNNTISGLDICGTGMNVTLFDISLFSFHNFSTIDIKLTQPALSSKRSFGIRNLTLVTKSCFDSCLDCSGSNYNDCIGCKMGYFYYFNNSKTECLADCPIIGYYKNLTNNSCDTCTISSCVNCSLVRTNCSQCQNLTYLLFGLCYPVCPLGYGKNAVSGNCDSCQVAFCSNCSFDSSFCLMCVNNSYLLNGTCYTNCPAYYSNNGTYGICQPCETNCTQCTSDGKNCTQCDNTTFLLNGKCLSDCSSGYFNNISTRQCIKCTVPNCKNCSLDAFNCTECYNTTSLLWGSCYSTCPFGYGRDIISGRCLQCSDNLCLNCSSGWTNCSECLANNFLLWGSCNYTCPTYYGSNITLKICIKCADQSCLECNGLGNNCSSCDTNTFLLNGSCFNPCPAKYTGNSTFGKCIPCNNTRCDNCSSDGLTCYECDSISYLLNGDCYGVCPRKYYGNITSKDCLSCNETCAYCSGPAYNDCTICETSYFSLNISSKVQCVALCPQKFSANISTYTCVACQDPNCLQCSDDGKNCSLCNITTYLLWGKCYSICPLGYGKNDSSGNCTLCVNNFCNNCSSDPTNCTTCLTNYFNLWGNCSSTCPDYYGTNTTLGACMRCTDVNCTTCNDIQTNCTKCSPDTYLLDKTCYYNCPITYTNNITFGVCLSCKDPNCNYCSSDTQICYNCNNRTYILNGSCYLSCPGGYWTNETDMTCMPCDYTCQNCTGPAPKNCTSCTPGAQRWFYLSQCLTSCPVVGFYPNNYTYICSNCSSTCYSCSDNTTTSCTSCISPRYLLNSACLMSCPQSYYPNSTVSVCQPCTDPYCLWCNTTYSLCDKCIVTSTMLLYLTDCIPQCPNGYYTDNATQRCVPCDSTCYSCSGPGSTNCTFCNGTNYFFNYTNECLPLCPGGFYSNQTDNKCYTCLENCLKCGDNTNTNCTLCNNNLNYYRDLYNGCWFATCGDGRKLGPTEQCDDGNNINGDGCDSTCQIERGWYCSEPNNYTLLSVCNTRCGDSILVVKTEVCDDGNANNGDGCNSLCTVENGYFCYGGGLYSKSICTCEPINSTISFSSNWENLIITYPKQLSTPTFPNNSSTLCDNLFDLSTISLLGAGYSCFITQNKIQISLGTYHLMDLNQNLNIIFGSFTASSCPQNPKSIELTISNIKPGDYNHHPQFFLNSTGLYFLCKFNTINITNITNVGKRDYSIAWDISMSSPVDTTTLNKAKLSLSKFTNSLEATFTPLVLLSANTYTITAALNPFWGTKGYDTESLKSSVTIQVRNPDPQIICKNPSKITFKPVATMRNSIILVFDRPIVNSSREILSTIDISISPGYSSNNFDPILTRIDDYNFNLTLVYKQSVFKKQLVISISDPSKLCDIYGNSFTGNNQYTTNLLDYDVYTSSQLSLSQQASNSAAAGIMAAIIPIILFASGPLILSFLNGAQVVNYLRFVNIYYPVNVEAFLRSFNNINLDFLPTIPSLFNINLPIIDQKSPFRFESLKISTMFLENAGGVIFMFLATFLGHQCIKILVKLPMPIKQIKKFLLGLNKFMVYNGYLLVIDSTYYQHSLSLFLQYSHFSTKNYWNSVSIIICILSSGLYFSYFIFLYKMASKGDVIYYTKHSALMKKLGVLFEDYDLRKPKARGFAMVICLRKMIHCIILIYLHDYVWTEILLLVLMNISFLLALAIIRPYFNMGRLKREMFIEFCYLLCHIFVGLMKYYEYDSDLKYNIGWGVVAGSMGIISVYLMDGIQMAIEKGKDLLRKLRNRLYQKYKKRSGKVAASPYIYHKEPSSVEKTEKIAKVENARIFKIPKNNLKRQITPAFWK